MKNINVRTGDQSRREFLRTAAKLSVAGTAAPFALNLAGIGAAAAQTATDYRALVCVFFYGANDHNNTVIPVDKTSYDKYFASRSSIARLAADVIPLTPSVALTGNNAGRQFGIAKELGPLKALWDSKKLAVVANVGTLVVPTTKTAFLNGTNLPPKLFSHNDQQSVWQSSSPEGSTLGWGGRMGDLFASSKAGYPQNTNKIFTCNSIAGSAVFLAGAQVAAYQVSPSGSVRISGISGSLFGSSNASATLKSIITAGGGSYLSQDLADTTARSIDADVALTAALTTAPDFPLTADVTDNSLAAQLRIVARMIASHDQVGAKRQVFFVGLGGFDTHDGQLQDQPVLHAQVANALAYFQTSIDSLPNMSDKVTTFTASDFGRTLASNGDGSDHGWGSHHFVMGGAVKGQRYYGTFPIMGIGNDDEVGSGRLLPSTSVTQYAATMARWFGVSESDLQTTVLPGIGGFQSNQAANLEFLG